MGCKSLWIFIISICLTHVFAKSLNHFHFDVAPIKLTKTFSLPQSLDTIEEEDNFWPNLDQNHHSQHYEKENNLLENLNKQQSSIPIENFSIWSEIFSKIIPKTDKITEEKKAVASKDSKEQSKIQNHLEKSVGTNFGKDSEFEKIPDAKKASGSKNFDRISDLIILDEVTKKLNDKSVSLHSQQEFTPKKAKVFFPIHNHPYSKSGILLDKQKHDSIPSIENNSNKQKDLDIDESKIKNQSKNDVNFDSRKNQIFPFNDLNAIPVHHFSQPKFPVSKFPSLTNLPESSLAMTSIFISPSQNHFKDAKLHDEEVVDSKMLNKISRTIGKPLLKKDVTPDIKQESLLNSINELESMKEVEKLSNISENCEKQTTNKYPVLYQFLEKFSDKILGAAMKYEIFNHHEALSQS